MLTLRHLLAQDHGATEQGEARHDTLPLLRQSVARTDLLPQRSLPGQLLRAQPDHQAEEGTFFSLIFLSFITVKVSI